MRKGFWLTLDGLLCLLLVIALLLSVPMPSASDTTQRLSVLQQEHDLLLHWQRSENLSIGQMQRETEWVFPHHSYELRMGNETIQKELSFYQPEQTSAETERWENAEQHYSIRLTIHH